MGHRFGCLFKLIYSFASLQRGHVALDLDLGLIVVEDVGTDCLVVAQVHRAHLVDVQVLRDDRREALQFRLCLPPCRDELSQES